MKAKTILKITAVVLVLIFVLVLLFLPASIFQEKARTHTPVAQADTPIPSAFTGDSSGLTKTEIVPTLETPLPKSKNIIWCVSFQMAWKALEQEFTGGSVSLDGNPETATVLNNAEPVRSSILPPAAYVATGWNQNGIVNKIQNEMRQRFPDRQPPNFPGLTPDGFVAYSYLEASLIFPLPYNQNMQPFVFTDSTKIKTDVNSFGIPVEDDGTYFKLRSQPAVLFRSDVFEDDSQFTSDEFAIDLCSNSLPDEIVLARISPQPTLAAALTHVEKGIASWKIVLRSENASIANGMQHIKPNDVLLLPNFNWFISHDFTDLEKRAVGNAKTSGQRLDLAEEDISFRLDKTGAELKAESKRYFTSVANKFVFDKPFLIYMKMRDAHMPYFVMWVDNAELMSLWQQKPLR